MRFVRFPASLMFLLLLGTLLPARQGKVSDKGGEVNDNHGNLKWRAAATEDAQKKDWEYARYITNRSQTHRCQVEWAFGKQRIKTTLEPAGSKVIEIKVHSERDSIGPAELAGKLTYNGGPEAGVATTDAPVWTTQRPLVAAAAKAGGTAHLGVAHGDRVEQYRVVCSAGFVEPAGGGAPRIDYSIHVVPVARQTPRPGGPLYVQWVASESKDFAQIIGNAPHYNSAVGGFDLRAPQMAQPIKFSKDGVQKGVKAPGAVRFVDESGRQVFAEAPMSVIVPDPSQR